MKMSVRFRLGLLVCCTLCAIGFGAGSQAFADPYYPDGDPGSCYYGPPNTNCWVYSHAQDQGLTACKQTYIYDDPGHAAPGGYTKQAAEGIAEIARGEGYQWAGGCYNNDDSVDGTQHQHPCGNNGEGGDCKPTNGEGPDCSGFVWRVWRESNVKNGAPPNFPVNEFWFWPRSWYDHGPYDTSDFKSPDANSPNQARSSKTSIKFLDALVSSTHMALWRYTYPDGYVSVYESLSENTIPGTGIFKEDYMNDPSYSVTFRKAWGS